MSYVPAAVVLLLGLVAVAVCVVQRNPRVPFIAILGLIVLTAAATMGLFVAFNPADGAAQPAPVEPLPPR